MAGFTINAVFAFGEPFGGAEAIAFVLAHGEAKVLITDPEFAPTIEAAFALLDGPKPLVIDALDAEVPSRREGTTELDAGPRQAVQEVCALEVRERPEVRHGGRPVEEGVGLVPDSSEPDAHVLFLPPPRPTAATTDTMRTMIPAYGIERNAVWSATTLSALATTG